MAVTVAVDSVYYGTLTLTPVSFLRTNVLSGIAHFYGVNVFHYYLTQGIPIVLGPALPFALHGVWKHVSSGPGQGHSSQARNPSLSILLAFVVWTLSIYSCLAHKEWRFIHPLLPVLHIFAADSLIRLKAETTKNVPNSDSLLKRLEQLPVQRNHMMLLLGISIPLNVYLTCLHGSAQVAAARYIHALGQDQSRVKSVGVLMPCHSIPWQSHIHLSYLAQEVSGSRLWALGCEPPLGLNSTQVKKYASQTDVFFETLGPISYFEKYFPLAVDPRFPPSPAPYTRPGRPVPEKGWEHRWPSHLLMFSALESQTSFGRTKTVGTKLEELGYQVIRRIRNGWEEDERRKGGVVVWEWNERIL
ncbi:glycosyltransferase family 22 protein [Ceratobasidium sp. AG-Ba]|nr:glycosyltransferase family 22 protein [Ceratobasidium sp. AG-Ba]